MSAVGDRLLQFAPDFQHLVITKWLTQELPTATKMVIPMILECVVHLLKFAVLGEWVFDVRQQNYSGDVANFHVRGIKFDNNGT